MSLAARMTRFTRPGAESGGMALPWTSFALEPLTVGFGSVVPVPPSPALVIGLRSASGVTQASVRAPANHRRLMRKGFEDIDRSPSSACAVLRRAGGKGA